MSRVVALANQKGGVGKTTATLCLARAAHLYHGARVLVIDMDSQGNSTSTLAPDPIGDSVTVADVLVPGSDVPLREVIVPSIWEGVDLAPGGPTMATAEAGLATMQYGREHQLREALDPVREDYDLVLIDNAPALGLLLINSLTAADATVLVTQAHRWSADGLALLGRTINGVRRYHNPQLTILGTIVNMWRATSNETRTVEDLVQGMAVHFPGVPVWLEHRIPLWVGITDALDAGLGLDQGPTRLRVLSTDTFQPLAAHLLEPAVTA